VANKIVSKECLCAFVASLGEGLKTEVSLLLSVAISSLRALQAQILLVSNVDALEDQGRKLAAEAALAALEIPVQPVEAILSLVNAYMAPFSDCDPVATAAKIVKYFKDQVFQDVDDWKFKIEQWGEAISERNKKIATINKMIGVLQEIKDAIDLCGEAP